MQSSQIHIRVIIILLLILGFFILGYQIFILKTPISKDQVDDYWTIEAKINFDVRGTQKVKVDFFVPPLNGNFMLSNELFVTPNYGENTTYEAYNRLMTWSARKVSGEQSILYRFNVSKNYLNEESAIPRGEDLRDPIPVPEEQKEAVERLVKEARSKSANVSTFITATINLINDPNNNDAKLLLGTDTSDENIVKLIELILSQARIPIQKVHTLPLKNSTNQHFMLWIRSYINPTLPTTELDNQPTNGSWYYFNPITASIGLPDDQLIWWIGDAPVMGVVNGQHARINISLTQRKLTAIQLTRLSTASDYLTEYSLHTLPNKTQLAYRIMLVIPFGVLLVLLLRNVIGLNTLGTFTPVLIALAFNETGLVFGLIFFSIIVFFGLLLRSYLEYLKLQMLPRLSIVLTFVVLLIVFFGLFCYKLGIEKGLSISLFPMVILTMTIERLSITWEERGASFALKIALGTVIAASLAYLLMHWGALVYFVFTFPAILLILIAFMLFMGRYRGYRLLELFRFQAMIEPKEDK